MRPSIKNKINFIILVVLILFSPILFLYFPKTEEKLLSKSYEKEVQGIARTVAFGVEIALEEHNFEGVQKAMNYTKNDKRMMFVALYKTDSMGHKSLLSLIPQRLKEENIVFTSNKNQLVHTESINTSGFKGNVVVGFSTTFMQNEINAATINTIKLSALVYVVALLLGYFVSRIITRPIDRLKATTQKITEGDLSVRTKKESNDEVGDLAESFNFMIQRLQENTQLLELQKKDLKAKNQQITDSINYSRRIQQVLLHNVTELKSSFNHSFLFFKPKDIVSGDFIWLKKTGDHLYLALVDCTGHGVPGAMMSIIGHFILNNIYENSEVLLPGQILERLNDRMRESLKQETNEASDGMDVALFRINRSTQELVFAGANRNMYLFKTDGEVLMLKGDRKGIGGKPPKHLTFQNHYLKPETNDWIVTYTDGIQDQFGTNNTKFGTQGVSKAVLNNRHKQGFEIISALNQHLQSHQGQVPQIDDMLVIGFKLD